MLKKLLAVALLSTSVFYFTACSDSTTDATTTSKTGKIVISSNPTGAKIYLNGVLQSKVTNDTITADSGSQQITLKLSGYTDTTFTVAVTPNQTVSKSVTLKAAVVVDTVSFTSIQMYESVDPSATHPSGISLKTGLAYSISGNATVIDLYYQTNGYLVCSADAFPGLSRITYLKAGSGSSLKDGVASPVKDASWVKQISDATTTYFFALTSDGNYAKGLIVDRGTTGSYKWIKVSWVYNKTVGSTTF